MSSLTLELLHDPELGRIVAQAHEEARAAAIRENRLYSRDEVIARMEKLLAWRDRALRAERELRRRDKIAAARRKRVESHATPAPADAGTERKET